MIMFLQNYWRPRDSVGSIAGACADRDISNLHAAFATALHSTVGAGRTVPLYGCHFGERKRNGRTNFTFSHWAGLLKFLLFIHWADLLKFELELLIRIKIDL